ncbi:CorA-like Mg2+ transporter protein, putative [Plasmodium ovale]|uniref:Magnesium transporter n=1 Tax=Plasmodium ovale TaxID=36330 RepID=A0A1D3THY2_PLAOA|nr:CorA-like Mg2+ transporter protein, putative [Plasmodium ovale]
MFQWKQVNICRRRITRTHLPLLWLSQFTTIKNENKIFSKKNFNNVLMQNIRISEDGKIACEKVFFSKYNLPYVLKIPVSDLRLIDTCNSNHNPTILVRKNMILVRTGFISCVIRFNEMWLFEPNNPLVAKATNLITENLKRREATEAEATEVVAPEQVDETDVVAPEQVNATDVVAPEQVNATDVVAPEQVDALCWTNEKNDISISKKKKKEQFSKKNEKNNSSENIKEEKDDINYLNIENNFCRYKGNIYFEFLCLDVCMQLSIKEYENDLEKINIKIKEIILLQKKKENKEINMLNNKSLKDMMKIKNILQKLSNLLNVLRSNIEKILKNKIDMKNMYLSYLNKYMIENLKDYNDLEILLETHLQLTDELYSELENMEEKITHYEELMRLNLDYNRNKLILLNAKISFSTLFFSICSVITSLFGMNLKNFVENNDYAFFLVSIFVFLWSFIGMYMTKNINTLLRFFDRYNIR